MAEAGFEHRCCCWEATLLVLKLGQEVWEEEAGDSRLVVAVGGWKSWVYLIGDKKL